MKSAREHLLSVLEILDDDSSKGTLADGLDRWLASVELRTKLPREHRQSLSPRTLAAHRYAAVFLVSELGHVSIEEMCELQVIDAFEAISRGSWHAVGTSWQAALSWLDVADAMPDRKMWANKRAPLTWDPDDYQRAFRALTAGYERAKVLRRGGSIAVSRCALFVAVSGLRVGEAVGIRREDIARGWVTVHGKTGERRIPLTRAMKQVIEECPSAGRLFPGRKGSTTPHVLATSVSKHVRRSCDRAGLDHVHTHWLRHAFASWLAQQGYKLLSISRLLGHSSVATTEKYYLHVADSDLEVAAEAVGDALTQGQISFGW